jgi:excisionase family DNA binding protein
MSIEVKSSFETLDAWQPAAIAAASSVLLSSGIGGEEVDVAPSGLLPSVRNQRWHQLAVGQLGEPAGFSGSDDGWKLGGREGHCAFIAGLSRMKDVIMRYMTKAGRLFPDASLPNTWGMRGLGDYHRRLTKRGDPRVPELFSHLRQILDLLEDMARHPHQQPEVAPPPTPPSSPPRTPAAPTPQVMTPEQPPPMLVSIKEARRLIGVGHTRIYDLINAGALETVRIGKRRMIRYSSLQKLASS